jgi:predicted enzyme related to lactoylglutathione lyase
MLKHVFYATMFVNDQDKALAFYTDVVGLETRWDVDAPGGAGRFLTVGVKGQDDFMVLLAPGTPGGQMTIEVEDCKEALETLKARGVNFDPPDVIELPFGWVARFEDPDGNRLQLRQGREAAV